MSDSGDFYEVVLDRLNDPVTVEVVRRALAQRVVLDTWMNGEKEEDISSEAEEAISTAAEELTRRALATGAILPHHHMPEGYVRSAMYEVLIGTALFEAQRKKGYRQVDISVAGDAVRIVRNFINTEPEGLTAAGGYYFLISAHEDLNAIDYYKQMKREDFLLGTLHRPWSNMFLTNQLGAYQMAGLVQTSFTGRGEMLELTRRGEEVLEGLRRVLAEAGEFEWRANAQRWVIFNETDYDAIYRQMFPDINQVTGTYIESLNLNPGTVILEIGAGTGRATVDLGLADLVNPGGKVIALDPSAQMLKSLQAKCLRQGIQNVQVVQGMAEDLPFPDDTFDATIAVVSLHFTNAPRAVAEMSRVTKPGGLVSALVPPSGFDLRSIPMVAIWFRPLASLADRWGMPFSDRVSLAPGVLEESFLQSGLEQVRIDKLPGIISAESHESFLAFVLKGAALFQHLLCKVPFAERWAIIRQLQQSGAEIASTTTPAEKRYIYHAEAAYGLVGTGAREAPLLHTPASRRRWVL